MTVMFCRNRVADFAKWKAVFDDHLKGQEEAGLRLRNLWRSIDEPNNVFFIFEVIELEKARAFIGAPEAAQAGQLSGVLDGECHFLEAAPGD